MFSNPSVRQFILDIILAIAKYFWFHWKCWTIHWKEWVPFEQGPSSKKKCKMGFYSPGLHSTSVYKETNDKIERIAEVFVYAMQGCTIALLLPALLYSFLEYYFMDSGKESFFLFLQSWLVGIIKPKWPKNSLKCFHFFEKKVAFRLENAVWIFSGMACSICRSHG